MSFVLKNFHAELHLLNKVIVVKVAVLIFTSFKDYMLSSEGIQR